MTDTSKGTVEQLADELAMGCLNHQPRWSGDTHFDLGGSVREDETDQMMEQGAKYLRALLAERDALEAENQRLREELGQLDAPLDDRMAALGMIPMSILLSGPPTPFSVHVGVNSLASFTDWLEKKNEVYLKMRMRYEVGMKPEEDELFEWIFAHSAVFGQVCDHFRAAMKGERHDEQL